jgi:hypothetical protein
MKNLFSHDELSLSYIIFSRKKEKGFCYLEYLLYLKICLFR